MAANLNALGIIFAPIFAIVVSLIWGTKPDRERVSSTVIIAVILCFLSAVLFPSLQTEPPRISDFPLYQIIIPVISLFPILLFIKKKVIRYPANMILILLAIGLTSQLSYLDKQRYSDRRPERMQEWYKRRVGQVKKTFSLFAIINQGDSNSYPEGWLSDSPLMTKMPDFFKEDIKKLKKNKYGGRTPPITYNLWHSSITRIYGVSILHPDLWYPGGKLSQDAIDKIYLKERIPYEISDIAYLLRGPVIY